MKSSRFPIHGSRFAIRVPALAAHCLLLTALLAAALLAAGCGGRLKGQSTRKVYAEAMGEGASEVVEDLREGFKVEQPLGYEEPVVPIMIPPDTMLIWFPSYRIDRRIFVHGHWLTVVTKEWDWNPEIEAVPGGSGSGGVEIPLPIHPESKPVTEGK